MVDEENYAVRTEDPQNDIIPKVHSTVKGNLNSASESLAELPKHGIAEEVKEAVVVAVELLGCIHIS